MIEMENAHPPNPQQLSKRPQDMEKGDGIGSPGNTREDTLSRFYEPMLPDVVKSLLFKGMEWVHLQIQQRKPYEGFSSIV